MQKKIFGIVGAIVLTGLSVTGVSAVLTQDSSMSSNGYSVTTTTKSNDRILPMPPVRNPFSQTNQTTILTEEEKLKMREKRLLKDNLQEFRKMQLEEYQEKAKQIREQRTECTKRIGQKTKERATAAKDMMKLCLERMKNAGDKSPATTCGKEAAAYAKETKSQLLDIKENCFANEERVLGLSTSVPAQY